MFYFFQPGATAAPDTVIAASDRHSPVSSLGSPVGDFEADYDDFDDEVDDDVMTPGVAQKPRSAQRPQTHGGIKQRTQPHGGHVGITRRAAELPQRHEERPKTQGGKPKSAKEGEKRAKGPKTTGSTRGFMAPTALSKVRATSKK